LSHWIHNLHAREQIVFVEHFFICWFYVCLCIQCKGCFRLFSLYELTQLCLSHVIFYMDRDTPNISFIYIYIYIYYSLSIKSKKFEIVKLNGPYYTVSPNIYSYVEFFIRVICIRLLCGYVISFEKCCVYFLPIVFVLFFLSWSFYLCKELKHLK